jgi:hypothetical protein
MMTLSTIGRSTRLLQNFLSFLKENRIELLADVALLETTATILVERPLHPKARIGKLEPDPDFSRPQGLALLPS